MPVERCKCCGAILKKPEPCPLTARELRILRELAKGRTYKQIGLEWGYPASTLRSHISIAYKKLGVNDRAQAVLLAYTNRWI